MYVCLDLEIAETVVFVYCEYYTLVVIVWWLVYSHNRMITFLKKFIA